VCVGVCGVGDVRVCVGASVCVGECVWAHRVGASVCGWVGVCVGECVCVCVWCVGVRVCVCVHVGFVICWRFGNIYTVP